jgi:hypothetical protein
MAFGCLSLTVRPLVSVFRTEGLFRLRPLSQAIIPAFLIPFVYASPSLHPPAPVTWVTPRALRTVDSPVRWSSADL